MLEELGSLELELQKVVSHLIWVLGIELRSFTRANSDLNHGVISLAPFIEFSKGFGETLSSSNVS